ncbi:MAG: Thiamine-monophosphate kinase [Candidatus Heimdallarchaeota archaeon LC_3]|nr:MAG: Thiamine-monophosphate kinase [Candidatus Heimdallarchaeota archaeon LC_3]
MVNKEIEFLSKIKKILHNNSNLLNGNEDAVAIKTSNIKGSKTIINLDSISWSSDVIKTVPFTYELFGRKLVSITLSDICAKGGNGKYFLSSISVPDNFLEENLESIIQGMVKACQKYSLEYLGGDLGTSLEPVLSGIIIGESDTVLRRNACEIDDDVWVTGRFGLTGLGFLEAFEDYEIPNDLRSLVEQKILYPTAKVRESQIIKKHANACIDSSDGLAISLYHLSNESQKKIIINELPIHADIVSLIKNNSEIKKNKIIFYAGEEFELIFTAPSEKEIKILKEFQEQGLETPCKIGKVVAGDSQIIDNTITPPKNLEIKGWDTLQQSTL